MGLERNGMRCSPMVAGGLLHIGTDNNTFVALDVATGAKVWSYTPAVSPPPACFDAQHPPPLGRPCEVYSSALLAGGLRFQGSEDNHARCFNATSGTLLWEVRRGSNIDGTPVAGAAGSSSIWIGASDGFLYNLDVATGDNALPPVPLCGNLETQPATDPDRGVLFSMTVCRTPLAPGASAGFVFALDMRSGKFLWNISCTGGVPIYAPDRNVVFVAGNNGTAFAADAATGKVIWKQHGISPLARFMGPFAYDQRRGLVYGANMAGLVCALDAASGKLVWTYLLKSPYTPYIPVPLGPRISRCAPVVQRPTLHLQCSAPLLCPSSRSSFALPLRAVWPTISEAPVGGGLRMRALLAAR